jgi:hypothetical protein
LYCGPGTDLGLFFDDSGFHLYGGKKRCRRNQRNY